MKADRMFAASKRFARGLAIGLAVSAAASAGAQGVKIGAVLPMTGDAAAYGRWMQRGMSIAMDEIKAQGGAARDLQLIIEDNKSSPKDSVVAMNKLLTTDKVSAVMTTLTGPTKALIPIAEQAGVVLTTSATLPGITENTKYVFRNSTNLSSEVDRLVEYSAGRYKTAAILWVNLEWASWGKTAFEKQFTARGGKIVADQSFPPDATNLRTQLLKIREEKPDVVLVLAYKTTGVAMKQARELGMSSPFIGTLDFELPEVVGIAKEAAEGAVYTKSAFDAEHPTSPEMSRYVAEYRKRFGEAPEVYSATMYDMLRLLAKAINDRGATADGIRSSVLATKDFPGASGKTTFLPNGDVSKSVELKTIKDGKYAAFSQ
ncbi:ABC transporter substrate-binding protein [soil metagenome]